MLKTTAPPSEQYNDPSLRSRSETIINLIKREDKNSEKIFTRRDMIDNDWRSQDKMNKLAQLRSAPPTYSPPKPPPFVQKEEHRHNFHADTRKNSRARFNTFTGENFQKIGITKKKKKTATDIFKMKVFTTKKNKKDKNEDINHSIDSISADSSQPIKKMLKLQATVSNPPTRPSRATEGMMSLIHTL